MIILRKPLLLLIDRSDNLLSTFLVSGGDLLQRQNRFLSFLVCSLLILSMYGNCAKPSHTTNPNSAASAAVLESGLKCIDPKSTSGSGSFILTKSQYQNSIEDLFGTSILNAAAADISTMSNDGYDADTYKRLGTISSSQMDAYFNAALTVSEALISNSSQVTKLFGSCAHLTTPPVTCIDTYLNNYARKILRRPLTTEEKNSAKALMAVSGDYKINLKSVLLSHLISPAFLWRLEMGSDTATVVNNKLSLTNYEIATRLAFTLTDSTPDDTLLAAAAAGELTMPIGVQQQIKRLLQTARGKKKIISLLLQWSKNDNVKGLSALPNETIDDLRLDMSGIESGMVKEASAFVEHIVFNLNGSFKDLLTSKLSFANHSGVAKLYGHAPIASGGPPVTVTQRRQGLLMKAGAWTWSVPRTNIILRGVEFQKRFLCNDIKSPTVDISNDRDSAALSEDEILTVTNRTAVAHNTEAPLCMSCHETINPTGFALESFDSMGRIRTQEKIFDKRTLNTYVRALPIHSASNVPISVVHTADVQDAYDLVTKVVDSRRGSACFSRNLYRFAFEKKETKADDCQISDVHNIISQPNKPILEAIEALLMNQHTFSKEVQ